MPLRYLSSVMFAILLVLFEATGCGSNRAVNPPLTGRIAFYSNRSATDRDDIFVMDANGASLMRLTSTRQRNWFPAFSPNGTFIAFQGEDPEQFGDIYRVQPNGQGETLLTPNTGRIDDILPSVSPDSKRIAFVSDRSGHPNIDTMNASDGSDVVQLTTTTSGSATEPAYAPDGRIVFIAKQDSGSGIFVMNADGSNQQHLTTSTAIDEFPAVSPRGDRIAFDSNRNGDFHIFTMRLDGSDIQQLNEISGMHPTYSPDGQWIAFSSNGNLVAQQVNGGRLVQITQGSNVDLAPSWGNY